VLAVVVHPAGENDRDGAEFLLDAKAADLPRLMKIWADQQYGGIEFVEWVKAEFGITLEIVKKDKDQAGFVVLPQRWKVERTIAWLGRYRRLSKDYEHLLESSETMVYIASIHLMVRRLCRVTTALKPHRARYGYRYLDYMEQAA
jgi:putative transposase